MAPRLALGLVLSSDCQKALGVHVRGPRSHLPGEGAWGILQPPARDVPRFWSCLWVGTRQGREEELTMPGVGVWGQVAPVPPPPTPAATQGSGVPIPLPLLSAPVWGDLASVFPSIPLNRLYLLLFPRSLLL